MNDGDERKKWMNHTQHQTHHGHGQQRRLIRQSCCYYFMPSFACSQVILFLLLQSLVFDASVTSLAPPHGKSQTRRMPPQSEDSLTTAAATALSSKTTINVIAIRHGTSISNEWMTGSNAWFSPTFCDDIQFVDSPLSEKGIQQAQQELPKKLQYVLNSMKTTNLDEVVVLVSPLLRCLQTWYYGVQPLLPSTTVPTIVVPLLRERVYSASDTGHPWGLLQTKCDEMFDKISLKSLDWSLMQESYTEQEAWWYSINDGQESPEEWRPCSEQQYYAVPGEPEVVFRERLQLLEEWLQREFSGKTVVLVTHWGVLHHFTRTEVSNCGICQFTLEDS